MFPVLPVILENTKQFSYPVYGTIIFGLDYADEMIGVIFGVVFDTKIIDTETKTVGQVKCLNIPVVPRRMIASR